MVQKKILAGAAAAVLVLGLVMAWLIGAFDSESPYKIAFVKNKIAIGANVPVQFQLIGPDGKALSADQVQIQSTRFDMAPDGMDSMYADLRPMPAPQPDIFAYEAGVNMGGKWELTLTFTISGVEGIFTSQGILDIGEDRDSMSSLAPASKGAGEREIAYYRNPMGLPDISSTPKKDSMGMDYIAVYKEDLGGPAGSVYLTPEKIQRIGVQLATATPRRLTRQIIAPGAVMADEATQSVIAPKFSGFIEKLYVPRSGVQVKAGQALARVWVESPELLSREADYLIALGGSAEEVETAANNLRLFGISDAALAELRRTRKPTRSISLTVPFSGMVLEKPAVEGMRFAAGDTLFKLADLSRVWFVADIAETDLNFVPSDQNVLVILDAFPSQPLRGKIDIIYPQLNLETRTAQLRVELDNSQDLLKAGLYGQVQFDADVTKLSVITVPESAVMDDGTRQIVFVEKGRGNFEPRHVTLGARGNGFVEIKQGLENGEKIVARGNFLIDAESNLQTALAGFSMAKLDSKP